MEPTKFSFEKHINTPAENKGIGYEKPTWSFINSFSGVEEFVSSDPNRTISCHDIHERLVKAKVVKADNNDHEHCCCYYYFYSKKAAENFIKRLNEYCEKKTELIKSAVRVMADAMLY